MLTVDDAIRAGKTHLEVSCAACRVMKQIPWRLLPGVMGSDKLSDLAQRLTCSACGLRPDPDTVSPWSQSDAHGCAKRFN